MAGHFKISGKHWPLLYIRVSGTLGDEQLQPFAQGLADAYGELQPYVALIDIRGADVPEPKQRSEYGKLAKRYDPIAKQWCKGAAIVLTNPFVRGAFTAVLWLARPTHPIKFFPAPEPALAWLSKQLQFSGEAATAMETFIQLQG